MKHFTELEVWKQSRKLAKEIYIISRTFPSEERFGLMQQIRNCAVSVPSNLAEGVGRKTKLDTIRFLYISKGSLNEVETQLYLSFDFEYLSESILNDRLSEIEHVRKMLCGLIKHYENK